MKRFRFRLGKAALAVVCVALVASITYAAGAASSKTGPAVDKIEFSAHGVDAALSDLKNGNIDLYEFGIKNTAAKNLAGSKDLTAYRAPSGSVSLILNPAPARNGDLNPFSLPDVRRAMNYLVDRNFIADSIYGGNAIPQTCHVSKLDYDYLTVASICANLRDPQTGENQGVRYDFDHAKRMMTKAMTGAGAKLVNGKWTYHGKTIRLKFIIRVEDERRDVGDAIATNLEKVGFEVLRSYQQFSGAIYKVYTTDPQAFEWHLYTEGWGRGSADRYDFANLNAMAAPWMGNMPGWQIFGFWQYQDAQLDRLGKEIFTGKFASKQERDALYRQATQLALNDAVRVWVATTYSTNPARKSLTHVTEDIVAGVKGLLTLREAYIPGKTTLRVGNLWVWTQQSAWNPVGGFEDVYSGDIFKNVYDPPIINDPFKGTPIPFRVNYAVTSAGPNGKMPVPKGAVVWNASKDVWASIPTGTQATSKVVFDFSKYFSSTWHDGQPMSMADVLYDIASTFERTYDPKKKQIEFVLAATQKPQLDVFKGFRVLDKNRIEVYLDYWHFDSNYIASYANIVPLSFPWEVMAASDALVYEKHMAAYSKSSAARYNLPWLSLASKNDALLVASVLRTYLASHSVPKSVANMFTVNGKKFVTPAQAAARYSAALAWFGKYQHLVISNGPFLLSRYDPAAQYAELLAFRDPTYPFKPGDWYRAKPMDITFTKVDVQKDKVDVTMTGPGTLTVNYLIVDLSSGSVVGTGAASRVNPGEFEIKLDPAVLKRYHGKFLDVTILVSSSAVALVSEKHVQISVP